jgi:uncharacterized protein involved in exopolysaccharide biosynthesis
VVLAEAQPDRCVLSGDLMVDAGSYGTELLAPAVENAELRLQLAQIQDQCVELAVDGGDLHAEIEAFRAELQEVRCQRDAWQAEAERFLSPARGAVR